MKLQSELFPHLVQTLRGEHPNKSRSYVRAIAESHALLGRVYTTLQSIPGALDTATTRLIEPSSLHQVDVRKLIQRGREISPPDETGTRFGMF